MTSMIERVARAIEDLPEWSGPYEYARAAIEAMREPDDALAEIMNRHAANGTIDWRDLHEAMIDAALKEQP